MSNYLSEATSWLKQALNESDLDTFFLMLNQLGAYALYHDEDGPVYWDRWIWIAGNSPTPPNSDLVSSDCFWGFRSILLFYSCPIIHRIDQVDWQGKCARTFGKIRVIRSSFWAYAAWGLYGSTSHPWLFVDTFQAEIPGQWFEPDEVVRTVLRPTRGLDTG